MTPPKVLGAAKPTSSVMIRRILGAPVGGTTRAGQLDFDCAALSSIRPWNGCGGGGRYLPSIVVVASGVPVICMFCCAATGATPARVMAIAEMKDTNRLIGMSPPSFTPPNHYRLPKIPLLYHYKEASVGLMASPFHSHRLRQMGRWISTSAGHPWRSPRREMGCFGNSTGSGACRYW